MRTLNDSLEEMGMKDHPTGSKKLDVEAIEDPKLVGMVENRLANLNRLTGRVPGKNPAVSDIDDDDSTPDEEDLDVEDDDKDDDDQAVSDDSDDDSTPDEDDLDVEDGDKDDDEKKSEKKSKDAIEIPDAYIRAAKGNGWKDEDIEEFIKVSPETARKTFENIHNTWNKASREWAAIGRASRTDRKGTDDTQDKHESGKTEKLEYGGVDLRKLKKEFDIDPAIESMIKSQNEDNEKLVDTLNKLLEGRIEQPAQDMSRVDRAARGYDVATEAVREQQINNFFTTDDMKPYSEFYGKLKYGEMWDDLSKGQARSRYAVYQTADQLIAGAAMHGQQMDIPEALDRAHLLVTEEMREKVIRSKIKNTSTKRRNSMVFRPSEGRSKKDGSSGRPKTKHELESKVEGLIRKALKK